MNHRIRHLLIAVGLAAIVGCHHAAAEPEGEKKQPEAPGITVRVQPAAERPIALAVTGLGRCEPLPDGRAVVSAAVEGRVTRFRAQPGDRVQAGQTIVELDPTIARANLDEKVAARDSQAAALRLLVARPRPEELASAKLAIQQNRLAVDKAKAAVERLRPLRQRNEIPEATMYEAELAVRQAELQWKSAEAQYQVLVLPPRPQAVDDAKARVAAAEAAVATAQAQLDLHALKSPIDGTLDDLACQLGQALSVGTTAGEVVDTRQVHAVVWLAVPDARPVRRGQTAELSLDDGKGIAAAAKLAGKVVVVGSVADPQTGNVPVRILVDNAKGGLTLGQVVTATIRVIEKKVLAVPAAAIQDLGEGPLVTVIRGGKTVLLHPTLGLKDQGWVEVGETDLKAGEAVVVEGGYKLPEGKAVAVRPAEGKE